MMSISIKKKMYFFSCCLIALTLNPTLSYGTSLWSILKAGQPVIAVGAGAAVSSDLGESQSFPFNQPILDTNFNYSPYGNTQVEPIFNIFVGEEWAIAPQWFLQLGLGYDQSVPFEASGTFKEGMLPILSQINFPYEYDIRVRQILVEGKLQYLYKDRYRPYFFLGLGASINSATNYKTYVPFPQLTRQYKDNTTASFSYSIGLGIDVDVLKNIRLGVGYRFADFGEADLGQSNIFGSPVAGTLSQSHLYANEVLAQLTFVIC